MEGRGLDKSCPIPKPIMDKKKRVPVFYSPNHLLHQPKWEYEKGTMQIYLEKAERIESARQKLLELSFTFEVQPAMQLTEDKILRVHNAQMLAVIQESAKHAEKMAAESGGDDPYLIPWIFPIQTSQRNQLINSPEPDGCFAYDLYAPIGRGSWQAALASANLAYSAAKTLIEDQISLGYALCRPPGHHAGRNFYGGYCYLNNAAIAADTLLQSLGRGVILDIDYHHGNGTQDIFWDNPDVLFISIHADPADEYPYFSGYTHETGGEKAQGATINLPLPMGADDPSYLQALDTALATIRSFQPAWMVFSAGFDTCLEDSTTSFLLTDEVYNVLGSRIGRLNLPMLIVHEGGYAIQKNGDLAARFLSGMINAGK